MIKDNDCRISMHPDQFCLINAKDENIINRNIEQYKTKLSDQTGKCIGAHVDHIDEKYFELFARETHDLQFDIMLEIKDKEQSAIIAVPYTARKRVCDQSGNYCYIYENAQHLQAEINEQKRIRAEKKQLKKCNE